MPTATLHRQSPSSPPLSPGRRRIAVGWAVAFVLLVVVALVAGLAFAFSDPHEGPATTDALANTPTARTGAATGPTQRELQDALAADPMPTLPAAAANPHGLLPGGSVTPMVLPAPTGVLGLVPTGYPRTVAGALAQLAAIDETAIADMNPAQVSQVYADWALAGADPVALWSVTQFVTQTLSASGIPDGSSKLQATFTVTEAQVKGVVGDEFVLACVNGEFDASLQDNTVRVGAADCARMVWSDRRWQIGPGSQPATPPDAWPGSAEASQVGWQPISHE